MSELVPADQFARLPEVYQRRAREIARRVGEIDALMSPAPVDAVIAAVVRMARQFREQPGEDQSEMAREFKAACADLPTWALSEAANDFLGGRVPNHTGQFMPTCAEFAKRARDVLLPFLAERSSLRIEAEKLVERATDEARRIAIEIERQNPAVKHRVAALIGEFTAGQHRGLPAQRGQLTAEKRAALDAYRKPRPDVSKIGHTGPDQSAE